jgi:hypothetical protein
LPEATIGHDHTKERRPLAEASSLVREEPPEDRAVPPSNPIRVDTQRLAPKGPLCLVQDARKFSTERFPGLLRREALSPEEARAFAIPIAATWAFVHQAENASRRGPRPSIRRRAAGIGCRPRISVEGRIDHLDLALVRRVRKWAILGSTRLVGVLAGTEWLVCCGSAL